MIDLKKPFLLVLMISGVQRIRLKMDRAENGLLAAWNMLALQVLAMRGI